MGALVHRRLFLRSAPYLFFSSSQIKELQWHASEQGYLSKQKATSIAASFKTNLILLYLHSNVCDNKH